MFFAKPVVFLALFIAGSLTFVVAGVVIFAVLAASGGPDEPAGACRYREIKPDSPDSPALRNVITDPVLAQTWQERWEAYRAEAAGQGAAITFDESEVTSRAREWLDDEDIPLTKVTVCFYEGQVEARATAEVPVASDIPLLGGAFETEVSARGTIDLSGEHPRIDITGIDAGSLPGFATGLVEDDIESLVNDELAHLTLEHAYDVTFTETRAEIAIR